MFKSIVAPVALVSLIWIAISVFSTFRLNTLIESTSRSLDEDVTTIESAWAMRRDVWRLQSAMLESTQFNSSQDRADIASQEQDFRKSLAQARRTSLTAQEVAAVDVIEARFIDYSARIHELLDDETVHNAGLTASNRADFSTMTSALTDACRSLIEINQHLIDQAAARNQRLYTMVTWIRFAAIIVGPAAGLLLGLWIARRLQQSVSQISAKLSQAGGSLNEDPLARTNPSGDLPALDRQARVIAERVGAIVAELETTRKQVIQSERLAALGELAAGIAHEIRNPLTSVKLLIQNAAQPGTARSFGEKQAEILLLEISRMESLVQDLLNFAQPPRLQLIRHDVRATIRRALNLVSSRAAQQAVRLEEDLPGSAVVLNGDPEQLLLVFLNLLINGIEAAKEGVVTLSLRTDGQVCRIIVRDTGGGIAPGVLQRLFEPFVTTKERGTGLGLAICRRLLHEHGGSIRAENAPDGGAVFTVVLPLTNRISNAATPGSATVSTSRLAVPGPAPHELLVSE